MLTGPGGSGYTHGGMPLRLFALALLVLTACERGAPHHFERGNNARFERRYEEAMGEYRRALEALDREGDTASAAVLRARVLRNVADVYWFEQGKSREAVTMYRQLIERCPEAPETLEARVILAGILHEKLHDARGAIDVLEAAIQRNPPQIAELTYKKASLYFSLGDYAQAEVEASRLAERFSTSAWVDDALFLRGQSLAMIESRRPEALRAFEELPERAPESPLVPHAIFERGRLLAESGQREPAIEVWVEALALHPNPQMVQDAIARTREQLRKADAEGPVTAKPAPLRRARSSMEALRAPSVVTP